MAHAVTKGHGGTGASSAPCKPQSYPVRVWVAGCGWFLVNLPLQARFSPRRLAAVAESKAVGWWGVSVCSASGRVAYRVLFQQRARPGTLRCK